jgi:hypothetical protein
MNRGSSSVNRRSDAEAHKERRATCGACGCERTVDKFLKRCRYFQFRERPLEYTDLFYCGCQDK